MYRFILITRIEYMQTFQIPSHFSKNGFLFISSTFLFAPTSSLSSWKFHEVTLFPPLSILSHLVYPWFYFPVKLSCNPASQVIYISEVGCDLMAPGKEMSTFLYPSIHQILDKATSCSGKFWQISFFYSAFPPPIFFLLLPLTLRSVGESLENPKNIPVRYSLLILHASLDSILLNNFLIKGKLILFRIS